MQHPDNEFTAIHFTECGNKLPVLVSWSKLVMYIDLFRK